MKKLNYKEIIYLKEMGLFSFGYAYLIRYLSNNEQESLTQIDDIGQRVDMMLNLLNDRNSLPKEYSKFVKKYNEFSGLLIPNEEIFY